MAIVGNAYVVVHAITTGFQKDIDDAMKGLKSNFNSAGISMGQAFSGGATSGLTAFQKQSLKTYQNINRLIEGSYYVQGAIAGLVPVLAAAVGGIFALGSQVAAATPALIVLPSIFSAVAQGAIAMKLAFSGVFKAVGLLTKKQGGLAAATDQVKDAQKRLDRVIEDNKESRIRAAKTVADAEKRLNKVREEAIEQLQQLNFDSEDAVISEKKAAIELEKARETLARVQDLPPNSRARREAELAFAEAELNLRKAKDKNSDLAKEAEKQNKIYAEKGVNGLEQVVDAQEALNDAKDAAAKVDRDALRSQIDAQEALDKAQKKAAGGGGNDPLKGLTPEAAEFAKYLASLKPKIDELKSAIGKELFPNLETAIDNLVKNLLPTLKPLLADTGKAAGLAAIDFSKIVTESENLKNLDTIGKTNTDTIRKLGGVAGNLYSVFTSLLAAADPLIRRFTDWVVTLTGGWKESARTSQETGKLTDMFNKAGDIAAQLGRILGNLGGAFFEMGKAAVGPGSGGQMIFDYLEEATKKFKDFAKVGNADGSLDAYFRGVADNFTKVLDILGKVTGAIMKTGDDKGTGDFLDSIANAVEILGKALGKLTEGGAGGAFGKFIEKMAEFVAHTSESGSIKVYFSIMTTALDLLNKVLSNPIAAKLLTLVAAAHGGRLAFGRLGKTFGTVREYLTGDKLSFMAMYKKTSLLRDGFNYARQGGAGFFSALKAGITNTKSYHKVLDAGKKIQTFWNATVKNSAIYTKLSSAATKAWTGIQAAFNAVMSANPIALVVIAIVALIAIVVVMYMKFKWFRDFVHTVWDAIKVGAEAAWNGIKAAFEVVWEAIKTAISFVWENIIKPIFEAFGTVFKLAWDGIKLYYETVWNIIKTGIEVGWAAIKIIFEAFKTVFSLAWDGIKAAFTLAWDAIKTSIDFVWNKIIKPIFEAFKTVFSAAWDGIKTTFTTVWDLIKGAINTGIEAIKTVVRGLIGVFTDVFTKIKDVVSNLFGKIGDLLKGVINGMLTGLEKGLNFVIKGLNKALDGIDKAAGPFVNFGEIPEVSLPRLATGGTVNSPTLAMIGEGGKPERVEPLDPDGLSKRDKAMIKLLAGNGSAGLTVNVHPSPGMDEVELASLVGRQIALQLRRGAA